MNLDRKVQMLSNITEILDLTIVVVWEVSFSTNTVFIDIFVLFSCMNETIAVKSTKTSNKKTPRSERKILKISYLVWLGIEYRFIAQPILMSMHIESMILIQKFSLKISLILINIRLAQLFGSRKAVNQIIIFSNNKTPISTKFDPRF